MIEPIIIHWDSDPSTSMLTDTLNLNDTVTAQQAKDDNRRHKNHLKAPTKKKRADDEPGSSEKAHQQNVGILVWPGQLDHVWLGSPGQI